MKKFLILLSLSLPLVISNGCATTGTTTDPAVTSGNALLAAQQTILNIHESFRAPCLSGVVKAADCHQVDALTMESGPAYDAAAAANIVALQGGSTADFTAKKVALDDLLGKAVALAIKYSIDPKGGAK